jgi:hypothetical protein
MNAGHWQFCIGAVHGAVGLVRFPFSDLSQTPLRSLPVRMALRTVSHLTRLITASSPDYNPHSE